MKELSVLIKPSSSLCNLRCKYCFYADVSDLREVKSFGIMKEGTMKKTIDNIYLDLDGGDTINFGFQGGEPALAGLEFFKEFTKYIKTKDTKVNVNYTIQTNGTLIDKDWCIFLKENNFLVGLSLDVLEEAHNKARVDANGKGTYDRVVSTQELFDHYKIEYNILSVLTQEIAGKPKEVWNYLLEKGIKYIQFIPCLDNLKVDSQDNDDDTSNHNKYSLKPQDFANFYKTIYPLWEKEYLNGNYISIKFFDDTAALLGRGRITSCGINGRCMMQYIIEADGSVYPCDFYVLDRYKMGNMTQSTLRELFSTTAARNFLHKEATSLDSKCKTCEYIRICGGGCKRMKDSMYLSQDGNYCGYKDCLQSFGENLMMIGRG